MFIITNIIKFIGFSSKITLFEQDQNLTIGLFFLFLIFFKIIKLYNIYFQIIISKNLK